MRKPGSSAPLAFFFLALPAGIGSGFVAVALPFILTQAGFSVAMVGYVVALGASPHLFRFVWGPVADFTLTPRYWYLIGLLITAGALFLLALIPLYPSAVGFLFAVVFISQVGAALVLLTSGGLIAHAITEEQKGRAAGFYQAGNLGGAGISVSSGVWLAAHYSNAVAICAISGAILACAFAIFLVPDLRLIGQETLRHQIKILGEDVLAIFRSRRTLLIIVAICSPIGVGAVSHLWGAIWRDWHATADALALVGGVLGGAAAAGGCVLGGWAADRIGLWFVYIASGISSAVVVILMATLPRTADIFLGGVLVHALILGSSHSAFSALILSAIGRGAASTKYALLSSLGNLPAAYMTALDGLVHDQRGTSAMLYFDALSGLVFVVVAIFFFKTKRPLFALAGFPRRSD